MVHNRQLLACLIFLFSYSALAFRANPHESPLPASALPTPIPISRIDTGRGPRPLPAIPASERADYECPRTGSQPYAFRPEEISFLAHSRFEQPSTQWITQSDPEALRSFQCRLSVMQASEPYGVPFDRWMPVAQAAVAWLQRNQSLATPGFLDRLGHEPHLSPAQLTDRTLQILRAYLYLQQARPSEETTQAKAVLERELATLSHLRGLAIPRTPQTPSELLTLLETSPRAFFEALERMPHGQRTEWLRDLASQNVGSPALSYLATQLAATTLGEIAPLSIEELRTAREQRARLRNQNLAAYCRASGADFFGARAPWHDDNEEAAALERRWSARSSAIRSYGSDGDFVARHLLGRARLSWEQTESLLLEAAHFSTPELARLVADLQPEGRLLRDLHLPDSTHAAFELDASEVHTLRGLLEAFLRARRAPLDNRVLSIHPNDATKDQLDALYFASLDARAVAEQGCPQLAGFASALTVQRMHLATQRAGLGEAEGTIQALWSATPEELDRQVLARMRDPNPHVFGEFLQALQIAHRGLRGSGLRHDGDPTFDRPIPILARQISERYERAFAEVRAAVQAGDWQKLAELRGRFVGELSPAFALAMTTGNERGHNIPPAIASAMGDVLSRYAEEFNLITALQATNRTAAHGYSPRTGTPLVFLPTGNDTIRPVPFETWQRQVADGYRNFRTLLERAVASSDVANSPNFFAQLFRGYGAFFDGTAIERADDHTRNADYNALAASVQALRALGISPDQLTALRDLMTAVTEHDDAGVRAADRRFLVNSASIALLPLPFLSTAMRAGTVATRLLVPPLLGAAAGAGASVLSQGAAIGDAALSGAPRPAFSLNAVYDSTITGLQIGSAVSVLRVAPPLQTFAVRGLGAWGATHAGVRAGFAAADGRPLTAGADLAMAAVPFAAGRFAGGNSAPRAGGTNPTSGGGVSPPSPVGGGFIASNSGSLPRAGSSVFTDPLRPSAPWANHTGGLSGGSLPTGSATAFSSNGAVSAVVPSGLRAGFGSRAAAAEGSAGGVAVAVAPRVASSGNVVVTRGSTTVTTPALVPSGASAPVAAPVAPLASAPGAHVAGGAVVPVVPPAEVPTYPDSLIRELADKVRRGEMTIEEARGRLGGDAVALTMLDYYSTTARVPARPPVHSYSGAPGAPGAPSAPAPAEVAAGAMREFVQWMRQSIQQRSADATARYAAATAAEQNGNGSNAGSRQNDVDLVVYGGGPHSAVLVANLRAAYPHLRIVVLEAGDGMGTFDTMRDTFRINTRETLGRSGNNVPGLPLQPRDFNPAGDVYMSSDRLGAATVGGHYAHGAPVLLHQRGNPPGELRRDADGVERFRVETTGQLQPDGTVAPNLVLHARMVVFATGLGAPQIRLASPAGQPPHQPSMELLAREAAAIQASLADECSGDPARRERCTHYAPGLQTVDDFLTTARRDQERHADPIARYLPESRNGVTTFVITGAGDGGNIAIEQIMRARARGKVKIIWIGQPSTTRTALLERMRGRAARYGAIADLFDQRNDDGEPILTAIPDAYTSRVEEIAGDPRRFRTYLADRNGQPLRDANGREVPPVEGHFGIFATGYENRVPGLMAASAPPGGSASLAPLSGDRGPFNVTPGLPDETVVGEQVVVRRADGTTQTLPMYVLGQAAGATYPSLHGPQGPLPSGAPAGTTTEFNLAYGGLLDLLAARTAAAAHVIGASFSSPLGMLIYHGAHQTPLMREVHVPSTPPLFNDANPLARLTKQQLLAKIEFARFLRGIHFQPGPTGRGAISLTFHMVDRGRPNQRLAVEFTGVAGESLALLTGRLNDNPLLLGLIRDMFESSGRSTVQLIVGARPDGTPRLEGMVLSTFD